MKGSALLLFGPVDKKSYTNLCWKCKEVSHAHLVLFSEEFSGFIYKVIFHPETDSH